MLTAINNFQVILKLKKTSKEKRKLLRSSITVKCFPVGLHATLSKEHFGN